MNKKEPISFEEAVTRLEQIVRTMEEGKLSLDDSLAMFEEGVSLVRFCNGRLDTAEQRVRILLAGENGEMLSRPFTASEA